MNRMLFYLLLFVGVSTSSGCLVSENIDFNEDFSGTYSLRMGMDLGFVLDYFSDENTEDASSVEGNSILYLDELLSSDSGSNTNNIENTDIELSREMELIEKSKINTNSQTTVKTDFQDIEELDELLNSVFISNVLSDEDRKLYAMKKSNIELSLKNNNLSRASTIIEEDANEINVATSQKEDGFMSRMSKLKFKYIKYRATYRFPKEIKSINSGNVILGEDKKTILLQPTSAEKISKKPSLLDFDLNFKD
jgi:hypothetical protein